MSDSTQLFAVTKSGPVALPVPAAATGIHDILDDMPLGVYEGLRTFEHVRFIGLEEHLDRAQRSIDAMGWSESLERDALRECLHQVVSDYPHADARVRFDILASVADAFDPPARVLIALSPYVPNNPEHMRCGVPVCLTRDLRRRSPLIKTADFVLARRVLPSMQPDCFEQMMVDGQDRILEGTTSNFFYVRNGVLGTAGDEVLEGITRQFIMRVARDLEIEVREEALPTTELDSLDEAFLSSSMKSIVPITRIDGRVVADGQPGPVTSKLIEAYAAFVQAAARPAVSR